MLMIKPHFSVPLVEETSGRRAEAAGALSNA